MHAKARSGGVEAGRDAVSVGSALGIAWNVQGRSTALAFPSCFRLGFL
jgi:hypothetical protein